MTVTTKDSDLNGQDHRMFRINRMQNMQRLYPVDPEHPVILFIHRFLLVVFVVPSWLGFLVTSRIDQPRLGEAFQPKLARIARAT
jgi:hypothetical protein